ncbi:MAG: NAD(P)/FAD-dependent oxidoreductase [Patescibacteria group bacterium]|nr:NAD(P)/FAD-dependent oxidoreductase [Patescibacteria group bacterium]
MPSNHFDIVIIGGGASGMFAASVLSSLDKIEDSDLRNKKILIIEKNEELGKKLKITGGGRCNIFNSEPDIRRLLSHYGKAEQQLYSPFAAFDNKKTKKYFESINVYTKTEDRHRDFPVTEKAVDVYEALYKNILTNKNVSICLDTSIIKFNLIELENINTKSQVKSIEVLCGGNKKLEIISADKFILSTGGTSHKQTGSTGDGFRLLKDLNIKIEEPSPSMVPLISNNEWVRSLSGKVLKNLKVTIWVDNIKKKVLNNKTENKDLDINILCTHFGLSGPSIINNSKYVKEYLKEGDVFFSIDLFKDLNEKELDQKILNVFDNNKNKKLKNILNEIYHDNILEKVFCYDNNLKDINLDSEVNTVSKEERKRIVQTLKNLKTRIEGLDSENNSIVADGGVNLTEVNFKNFSLNKIPNLHVTGDMLNVSRPSGGYSLQLCWTSGYLAATK